MRSLVCSPRIVHSASRLAVASTAFARREEDRGET